MMSGTTLSKALLLTSPAATANAAAGSSNFVIIGALARGRSFPESSSSCFTPSGRRSCSTVALRQLVSKTGAGIRSRQSTLAAAGLGVASTLANVRKAQVVWVSSTGRSNLGSGGVVAATSSRAQDLAVEASQMAEAEKLPVVSVDWLHEHLNDRDLKVLDASWYMPSDKRNPLQEYRESHIPGAIFFDIDAIVDITSEMPHMLPSQAAFSAAASALGLQNHDKIVVHDGKGIFSAARVWWMFRAFGHEKVWVLDGGLPQWLRQNYPVESAASLTALGKIGTASEAIKKIYGGEQVDSGVFKSQLQQNLVLSLNEVKENITEKKYLLVDARSEARFDGSAPEPRKGVKGGHVPGSTCVPFTEVLTSTGTLLPAQDLVGKFQQAGVSLDSPVAVSCGTGVTACILALALYRLGKVDVPVYDGSWTEWGLAPNVPVETNV